MLEAVTVVDAGGLGRRVEPRYLADLFGRNAGDPLSPLRRVLPHVLGELVESERPLLHELRVVQLLADDDVQHPERERGVRAGPNRHPDVGQRNVRLHGRFDCHHLRPARLGVQQLLHAALGTARIHRLLRPYEHQLGVVDVGPRRRPQSIGKRESLLHGADAAVPVIGTAMRGQEAVQVIAVAAVGGR